MVLSPGLRHLVIISMIASDPDEGHEVIGVLTGKYPALRSVYLHFPDDYWMTWMEYPRLKGQGMQRGFLSTGYLNVRCDWF